MAQGILTDGGRFIRLRWHQRSRARRPRPLPYSGSLLRGQEDPTQVLEAFANLITSPVCSTTPHPACHGVFVAGDWEVIEGRKFTGWILTERPDSLIPDLHSRTGGTSRSWTRCPCSPRRPSPSRQPGRRTAQHVGGMGSEVLGPGPRAASQPAKEEKTFWLRSALTKGRR